MNCVSKSPLAGITTDRNHLEDLPGGFLLKHHVWRKCLGYITKRTKILQTSTPNDTRHRFPSPLIAEPYLPELEKITPAIGYKTTCGASLCTSWYTTRHLLPFDSGLVWSTQTQHCTTTAREFHRAVTTPDSGVAYSVDKVGQLR